MLRRPSQRGFTIIEGVIALVILAIALPAMLWAVRLAHLGRIAPVLTSRARWLATEKLEDIIADRHSAARGYGYLVAGNYAAESPVTGFPGFSRSVAFNMTGPDLVSAGTGYKKVTVTVGWTDGAGAAQALAVSTVVTDYTP
jgi:prepilin-type N-terminal cleavage/methylation domain-containing protein